MTVTGLGSILQPNRRGTPWSGFLCPPIDDASYPGQAIERLQIRPDHDIWINDPTRLSQLSGWLLDQRADGGPGKTEAARWYLLLRLAH